MTREILFRGKRIDNEKRVVGNLIRNKDHCFIVEPVENSYIGYCYDCDRPYIDQFDVVPETVCQYTGLTDKNGVEIFEKDIVKLILPDGEIRYFKVSIKSVVRKVLCHPDFNDEVSKVEITGIVFEWNGYELFPCVDTYGVPDYKTMEVIGNIFDNPEIAEQITKEKWNGR